MKLEPLTSYHRVENVDIAYNTFLNSSLELGSGRGEKMPRNVRFAHNLFAAAQTFLSARRRQGIMPAAP